MKEKETDNYLKLEDILKIISKYENKNILSKGFYTEQVINKKRRLHKLLNDAKEAAYEIMKESRKLADSYIIYYDDFESILLSMDNLLEYLSKKIGDSDIMEEVRKVEKSLCDPVVRQQGIDEGIEKGQKTAIYSVTKKLIQYGMSDEQIADITRAEELDFHDIEINNQD